MSKMAGDSEANLRRAFEEAEKNAPAITVAPRGRRSSAVSSAVNNQTLQNYFHIINNYYKKPFILTIECKGQKLIEIVSVNLPEFIFLVENKEISYIAVSK